MKLRLNQRRRRQQGVIIPYLIILILLTTAIAGLANYVSQTITLGHRRADMITAAQFAQGGAAIAGIDLDGAITSGGTVSTNLAAKGYSPNNTAGGGQNSVYQRTITSPFTNQSVTAQIWMPTNSGISTAKVIAIARVGQVTQTATLHLQMSFGEGAAVISTNPGSTQTGISKSVAQTGNVVVNGDKTGPIVIDGGSGLAILANGRANVDTTYANIPASAVSANNYNTSNQIPDYTDPGSADQLFDFNRFIAVADLTPGASSALNNHYTNVTTFKTAMNNLKGAFMEGIVVVNIRKAEMSNSLDPTDFPYGINIHGTLVFNFASDVSTGDKIINTSTMNINPADLSHLVAGDPSTYTTGYPPVYNNPSKNPINIDITSKGYANFTSSDDLPAMMYNIGIFDIHGNVNICGALYSPSFFEIENKADGQIQYFKGALIGGDGIYYENLKHSTSIISYDGHALDQLATEGTKAKHLFATYWE